MMDHEWANPVAQQRHYELFARYVKPRFQGVAKGPLRAEHRAIGEWQALGDRVEKAVQAATDAHFGTDDSQCADRLRPVPEVVDDRMS